MIRFVYSDFHGGVVLESLTGQQVVVDDELLGVLDVQSLLTELKLYSLRIVVPLIQHFREDGGIEGFSLPWDSVGMITKTPKAVEFFTREPLSWYEVDNFRIFQTLQKVMEDYKSADLLEILDGGRAGDFVRVRKTQDRVIQEKQIYERYRRSPNSIVVDGTTFIAKQDQSVLKYVGPEPKL